MYFEQITVPGLGCFSYVIGCPAAQAMVVVDPKRDVQDYLDISRNEGMKITHIIDTHVHADHVSGSQELRSHTRAKVCLHENAPVEFEHEKLKEGDVIVAANGQDTRSMRELQVIIGGKKVGDRIELRIRRLTSANGLR